MKEIKYSETYSDKNWTYRHVQIGPQLYRLMPKDELMTEGKWRSFGLEMSLGWEHYVLNKVDPMTLLFRRPRNKMKKIRQENISSEE